MTWQQQAACKDSPLDFFSDIPTRQREAKQVCDTCPVIADCAEFAMQNERDQTGQPSAKEFRAGIFGGLTGFERWAIDYPEAAERKRRLDRERKTPKPKSTRSGTSIAWSDRSPERRAAKLAAARARYATLSPDEKRKRRGTVNREAKRVSDARYDAKRRGRRDALVSQA